MELVAPPPWPRPPRRLRPRLSLARERAERVEWAERGERVESGWRSYGATSAWKGWVHHADRPYERVASAIIIWVEGMET